MAYKRKSIVTGALILTAASIITRLLGFAYRIYMSNTIGAEGMGLYQLIMPIYGLAWSISCAGFTTTISKIVAAENAKRAFGNMGRALKQSVLITGVLGTILFVLMYFGATYMGTNILKDTRTILPLQILAFAIPCMATSSCIRGYFLGLQESTIPALSQVLEQCIRMGVVYVLAGTMIPLGLSYAAAAAVVGIVVGEIISFLFVVFAYGFFKRKNGLISKPTISSFAMFTMIFSMAMPLTANRISGSLLSSIENILIPQQLQLFGMTQTQAISTYGQITGMALPLIFFPSAILVSLSIALVPAVSEAMATKNTTRISTTISKALLFTSIVALGGATIFLVLPDELGFVIYKQNIGNILFMLGFMCPFWYLSITFSGILNGLGEQMFIFRNNLLSSVINIAFVYFLVPRYGVSAFVIGWFLSLVMVTVLDLNKIVACTHIKTPLIRWFAKPALAALATGLTVEYLANHVLFAQFGNTMGLVVAISLIVIMYGFFIVLFGCISISDIKQLYLEKRGKRLKEAQHLASFLF